MMEIGIVSISFEKKRLNMFLTELYVRIFNKLRLFDFFDLKYINIYEEIH